MSWVRPIPKAHSRVQLAEGPRTHQSQKTEYSVIMRNRRIPPNRPDDRERALEPSFPSHAAPLPHLSAANLPHLSLSRSATPPSPAPIPSPPRRLSPDGAHLQLGGDLGPGGDLPGSGRRGRSGRRCAYRSGLAASNEAKVWFLLLCIRLMGTMD